MELKLINGDYVSDGSGGQVGLSGSEALLQRVLFRLTARRGRFPLVENMGSHLWKLSRESGSRRLSAARQYVAEALAEENVVLTDIRLEEAGNGRLRLEVELRSDGDDLRAVLII